MPTAVEPLGQPGSTRDSFKDQRVDFSSSFPLYATQHYIYIQVFLNPIKKKTHFYKEFYKQT